MSPAHQASCSAATDSDSASCRCGLGQNEADKLGQGGPQDLIPHSFCQHCASETMGTTQSGQRNGNGDEGKSQRGNSAVFAMVIRSSGASLFFFLSLCYFLFSSLHRSSFSPLSFSNPFHLVFSFTSRFILTCSISYRFIQFTKITRVSWLNQSWMMTELLPSSDVRCVSFHAFRLAVLPNSSDVLVSRP